jgi:biopolymer transport protein ExbB
MRRFPLLALLFVAAHAWSQSAALPADASAPQTSTATTPAATPESPPARSLQELLERVRAARSSGIEADAARQKTFVEERERQQSRLAAAREELAEATQRASTLEQRFEITQRTVDARAAELHARLGALEQVFRHLGEQGTALRPQLQDSALAAEVGNARVRDLDALLATAASGDRLPTAAALEGLWFELQRELAEGGALRRIESTVRAADGSDAPRALLRIGSFGAVDEAGRYLRYRGEDGIFLELPRQPQQDLRDAAAEFFAAKDGLQPVILDPTGAIDGAALAAAAAAPTLGERLAAGGTAGRFALLLGLLAGAFAVWRLVLVEHWNAALRAAALLPVTHPVARLRAVAAAHPGLEANALEHLLHDAQLREMPAIELGLPALRLVAAAVPLCGVLGTVVAVMQAPAQGASFAALTLAPALASTVAGLSVGILVLLLQAVLAARARVLAHALDQEAASLVAQAAGGSR